ncbi:MAG: HAMP domain-containing histidine kinase [Actinobacteria bacterium]|nr:HAMP domain-containing histidine kinase [Actinomycetota bacterium]
MPYLGQINKNLLSIIIPFSVFSIIVSKFLSVKIAAPLERVENTIRRFTNGEELHIPIVDISKSNYNYIHEFTVLETFVYDALEIHKDKFHFEMEFAKMATQVAHDIKSPMVVLNNYFKEIIKTDDTKTEVIDSSLSRMNEIANNLITQYKSINNRQQLDSNYIGKEFIYKILASIVAEKKLQFKNKSVLINLISDESLKLVCVSFNTENFKRVISNLINNAVESIETDGSVIVLLKKEHNNLILEIKDSGCGIPDAILNKIEFYGTFGKKEGIGLGLPHAFKNIKEWGASYKIMSKINYGSSFSIIFPIKDPPEWIQTEIYIGEDFNIIIVDDDYSVFDLWKNKIAANFNDSQNIFFTYLKSPKELTEYIVKNEVDLRKTILLVDFHFIGLNESGFEVIQKLSIDKNSIIVSSQYPNTAMKQMFKKNKIKFILKENIPEIQITKIYKNPDFILLDDQKLVTKTWHIQSKKFNKKIITFNNTDIFMNLIHFFDKETNIYLDSNLGDESGESIAKDLFDIGFCNIYITTGYDPKIFRDVPWIKGIIGKEPPFLNNLI